MGKAVKVAARHGVRLTMEVKLEFFLLGRNSIEHSDDGIYFDVPPGDLAINVIVNIVVYIEDTRYFIEKVIMRRRSDNVKITFKYDDPITVTDRVIAYKIAVKI